MADREPFDPEILPGQLALPADWKAVFGRAAPLEVEIGSGGGRFVIAQAEAHPERNFLGIEQAGKYFYTMKARVAKRRLPNLKVCRTDAADLIACCFPDACVALYHCYFPDPWPKDRHRKRRLFSDAFCGQLRRTLSAGGLLYFATDHEAYLAELLPKLRAHLTVTAHPEPWADAPLGRTNFEIKYLKAGRPIYRYVARCPQA